MPTFETTGSPRRRHVLARMGAATVAGLAGARPGRAQAAPLRIGVISDQSGPYRGTGGPASVAGARLAVSDFGGSAGPADRNPGR